MILWHHDQDTLQQPSQDASQGYIKMVFFHVSDKKMNLHLENTEMK